jgi:hypothetical protein
MFQPPVDPNADEQTQQMVQVSSSMSLIMPLFIVYLSLQPLIFQGLVLYWIVSNLFSIGQQYFVNGWGQLPILGRTTLPPVDSGGDGGRGSRGRPDGKDGKRGKVAAGYVGQPEPAGAAQGGSRRGRRR